MSETHSNIVHVSVEKEIKKSYLDYAMSVIVGRALPDVRDGLKPVHRRVLYAMYELKNDFDKPYKKSARVVGDVIGKYHPHGDTAIYDSIVRMAQDFSMRYPLVDGQGNFGSVDGDAPAAMRYTEIRMARVAHDVLSDLDKDTVDFVPNYDNTETCPSVLPTRVPNLLVNGSSGIAVGMATNIPPHNLTEVINATLALIEEPDASIDALMEHIQGPDFPTRGSINGRAGIRDAYHTGRGRISIRATANIEDMDAAGAKQAIVVTELPYQVNKARLLEKIGELVREKRVEGISALRDESDKQGMRMVIELKRGENAEVLLNNLYQLTQLEVVFGMNMVVLDGGQPKCMHLKGLLSAFVQHRQVVVTRRTIYLLAKARARGHVLEGLAIALSNIDAMIALIKQSTSPSEAKEALLGQPWPMGWVETLLGDDLQLCRPDDLPDHYGVHGQAYHLSPLQAQAILELKLHRLTGLEQDKIRAEYLDVMAKIHELKAILASHARLMDVIREELVAIRDQYGDERRTAINARRDLSELDLIPDDPVVVTLSHQGYVKVQHRETYQAQRRGGKGKAATAMKDDDFIHQCQVANAHDTLMCFTNLGRVYWLKIYQLPMASRTSKGRPIVNYLALQPEERVTTILPLREFDTDQQLVFLTSSGTIKRCALNLFARPRSAGVIAIDLLDDDRLIGVSITEGDDHLMVFTNVGKVIRFHETEVRSMGRTARGVRAVKLHHGQRCVALLVAKPGVQILTATERGFGKQTPLDQFRTTARGGQGIIAMQTSERNGAMIGALAVMPSDDIMLVGNAGTLVRTRVDEVSSVGRNTQGVRLIDLDDEESLIAIELVADTAVDAVEADGDDASLEHGVEA